MVKNIKIKKVKYFWLYIVLGALGVIASIILGTMPLENLGAKHIRNNNCRRYFILCWLLSNKKDY